VHDEFAAFQRGDRQGAVAASLDPDRELRKTYEEALAQGQSTADNSIRSASSSVAAASTRSVWILVAALLVGLLAGACVMYWLMRAVCAPAVQSCGSAYTGHAHLTQRCSGLHQ
jgi:hypothetical protein